VVRISPRLSPVAAPATVAMSSKVSKFRRFIAVR
jgi:hypothetical protein